MIETHEQVLKRLQSRGLYLATHKCWFFAPTMESCGRIYSGEGETNDPERVQGLVEIKRPETVGGFTQFLQAAN